jgi:TRAP-type C4-dicarboxylate transport system permease small subunit
MSQSGGSKRAGLEAFSRWIILITGLGVLAITLLVSYDVLMRYFLDRPQLFVDELTSFILVGVIFFGTGPVFYKGGHIRVDLVTSHLKSKTQRGLRVATLFIGIALLGIITYETLVSTVVAFQMGRLSAVMAYPIWIAMSFIPLGLILMAFFMLIGLVVEITHKKDKEPEGLKDISTEISH